MRQPENARKTDTPRAKSRHTAPLVTCIILAALTFALLPWVRVQLPAVPSFIAAVMFVGIFADIMICSVLVSRFNITGLRATLALAGGYALVAVLTLGYVVSFPGVFAPASPPFADAQISMWLFVLWHAVFPLVIIAYCAVMRWDGQPLPVEQRPWTASLALGAAVCLACALVVAVAAWSPSLPALIDGRAYNGVFTRGVFLLIALLSAAAFLMATQIDERPTNVQSWLKVSALALLADLALTLAAGERFTLGWYAGQFFAMAASSVMLIAIVYELHVLYERLNVTSEHFKYLAHTDALTGVANRRSLDDRLRIEWERARNAGRAISLLLVDVDHFKLYNDRYGHPAGDESLRRIAGALTHAARRDDFVARWGGEEFAVLLPGADDATAGLVAQRLHETVAALRLAHVESPVGAFVTLSVGGATAVHPAGVALPAFVEEADRALYRSKTGGRNMTTSVTLGEREPVAVPSGARG